MLVFLLGLKKVKTGSHFFPIVPGVSMRIDTEINPGSTCIEGKLFGGSETKYKKMHFTVKHSNLEPIDADCKSLMFWKILEAEVKHSNLEPIDADCKSLMFWKILEAEYVEHVHLKSAENI